MRTSLRPEYGIRSSTTRAASVVAFVCALLPAIPASAAAIGSFAYTLHPQAGPIFTITNDSQVLAALGLGPGTFLDGRVQVFDGASLVEEMAFGLSPLDPGSVDAGNGIQFVSGLSSLTDGTALLSLTFSVRGSITIAPLASLSFRSDPNGLDPGDPSIIYAGTFTDPESNTTPIDFTPAAEPIPEPSTLLLLGAGAVGLIRLRVKRRAGGSG
jgi:hypothetical protein